MTQEEAVAVAANFIRRQLQDYPATLANIRWADPSVRFVPAKDAEESFDGRAT
jgi:hypothetical protein